MALRRCWSSRRGFGPLLAVLALHGLALTPSPTSAQQAGAPHDHAMHMGGMQGGASPLEQPGNAAFSAIQEVVEALSARADTDWSRVDLEALRQHLVDMNRFTLEAEVVGHEDVEGGIRVAVRGTNPEAGASIRRALHAHAPMLEAEVGWHATVTDLEDRTVLEVTSDVAAEVQRIRGLGYIGLLATGVHHREHHWQIATGQQLHDHPE